MGFTLHPSLTKKIFVIDLPLCRVLLEDESHYPWLILVPKRSSMSRMMDLKPSDQGLLMQELDLAQRVLWNLFKPTQVNVAAIGNKTPQLHVHVIARFSSDPAWPHTVWDHPIKKPYAPKEKEEVTSKLREEFCRKTS
jgi:diadenosine tetraphosphate (Ap4A) HIT family hydrolase